MKKNKNKDNKSSFQKKPFKAQIDDSQTETDPNYKKILLFPGEEYEFNEKLIHYGAFGYANGNLISKKCGILLCDKNGKVVDNTSEEVFRSLGKYYSPKEEDVVIGIIVQKTSEFVKVDINTYSYAILNTKDFEGATKKLKPIINLGDLVFARVSKINKFDSPVLSCVSEYAGNKSWASGESFFGILNGGNVYDFPKNYVWDFYKGNYALQRLNDVANFEIVFGMNGKMWIKSDSSENISNIHEILIKSLKSDREEIEKLIHEKFVNKLK
jgi:exosome complex RNA-binding protein Rrp4